MKCKIPILPAITLLVCVGISVADAAPVPLPANETLAGLIGLNAGGGVQIGNYIFSDFSYVPTTFNASNPTPSAAQVSVTTAPGPGIGLTFNSIWESVPGGNQDAAISYAVHVTTGSINLVSMAFNGAAPVPSLGTLASVTETVSTLLTNDSGDAIGAGPTILGQISVSNSSSGGSTTTNSSSLALTPCETGIFVQKDIALTSGPGGIATISFVDNTCQGTAGGPIPEPASLGLLGLVGLGLLGRRSWA